MIDIKIYKIDGSYIETYKKWGKELENTLKEDVQALLKEENCVLEAIKVFEVNSEWYAVGVMVTYPYGEEFKKPNGESEINTTHRMHNKKLFLIPVALEDLYTIYT